MVHVDVTLQCFDDCKCMVNVNLVCAVLLCFIGHLLMRVVEDEHENHLRIFIFNFSIMFVVDV